MTVSQVGRSARAIRKMNRPHVSVDLGDREVQKRQRPGDGGIVGQHYPFPREDADSTLPSISTRKKARKKVNLPIPPW